MTSYELAERLYNVLRDATLRDMREPDMPLWRDARPEVRAHWVRVAAEAQRSMLGEVFAKISTTIGDVERDQRCAIVDDVMPAPAPAAR